MLKNLIFSLTIFTLTSYSAFAISTTSKTVLSDGVALEQIQAYASSSEDSEKVGVLEEGTEVLEHKTLMKTKPGLATMEKEPWDRDIPFDRGAHVYIWEYLENGLSKIYINGVPYTTKIARSLSECDRILRDPKYCWARVIEEPEYYEWKQVSLTEDGQKFWILNRIVDGGGIISIKDEAVSKTRIVKTKRIKQDETNPSIQTTVEEKIEKESIFDESLLDNIDLPDDPYQAELIKSMFKPKTQEMEEENKEESLKETEKLPSQEEIFKQQSATDLQINFDKKNTTENTIENINKDLSEQPATKLTLEPNKPLSL